MTFEYFIKKPAQTVFDKLTELAEVSSTDFSRNSIYSRSIRKRFWFTPYSYSHTRTTVDENRKRVCRKTQIMKLLEIRRVYQIEAKGNGTVIRENVIVKGNALLKRLIGDNLRDTCSRWFTPEREF